MSTPFAGIQPFDEEASSSEGKSEITVELERMQQPKMLQETLATRFARSFSSVGRKEDSVVLDVRDKQVAEEMSVDSVPPPEHQIHLEWRNIRYSMTEGGKGLPCCRKEVRHRPILQDVSGEVRPGQLMVILGPSGAGKTTLLNVLSGRIPTSRLDGGEININGQPRNKHLKRHAAIVLQEDIFFSSLTVRQTLTLTGQLLLPSSMSNEEKLQRVEDIISLLKLNKASNTRVGDEMMRGLSGGEKKRLNIANELITNPSLLILDEPTSGLDSFLADEVVTILHMLARTGRTVMTTLHQPSSQMFGLFDVLCLMGEGGRVAYFGPANKCIPFFSKIGRPCPALYNPADFFLGQVQAHFDWGFDYSTGHFFWPAHEGEDAKMSGYIKDLSADKLYSNSNEFDLVDDDDDDDDDDDGNPKKGGALLQAADANPQEDNYVMPSPLPPADEKWPIGWFKQFKLLYGRAFRQHMFAGFFNTFIFMIIAVFGAIVWWDRGYSLQEVFDRQGLLFFILLQWTLFPMFGSAQILIPELTIVKKERGEGQYRISAFGAAKTLAVFTIDVTGPILFCLLLYWTTNLNSGADRFFSFLVVIILAHLTGQAAGELIAGITANIPLSSTVMLVTCFAWMLTGGFYASIDNIPSWFSWLSYLSPIRYLFDALLINEFDDDVEFIDEDSGDIITGREILENYDPVIWDGWYSVWYNVLVIFGMYLVFRISAYFALRWRTESVMTTD